MPKMNLHTNSNSPSASKHSIHVTGHMVVQVHRDESPNVILKNASSGTGPAPAKATQAKNKLKQPSIKRAMTTAAERLNGEARMGKTAAVPRTPESCGSKGDPHKEDGALARRGTHISTKRRRKLDDSFSGEANSSRAHADLGA